MKNAAHHGILKTLIASFLALGALLPSQAEMEEQLVGDVVSGGVAYRLWCYWYDWKDEHGVWHTEWFRNADVIGRAPGFEDKVITTVPSVLEVPNTSTTNGVRVSGAKFDVRRHDGYDRVNQCEVVILGNGRSRIGGAGSYNDRQDIRRVTLKGIASVTGEVLARDGVWVEYYGCFANCSNLEAVDADEALVDVGDRAFLDCPALKELNGFSDVRTIGWKAFMGCGALSEFVFTNRLESIGPSAFSGCRSLSEIFIPDSVTNMERCVFEDCTGLRNIRLGAGWSPITHAPFDTIGGSPLDNLDTVTINGSGETEVEMGAFEWGNMRHVVMTGVKRLRDGKILAGHGTGAFSSCTNLVSVSADDALEYVGVYSFWNDTALKDVIGFKNVRTIQGSAFQNCKSLPTISLAPALGTIAVGAFEGCSSLCEVVIPDSVTNIGGWAFKDCLSITNIVIGRGMTYIPDSRFSYEMPNLDTVTINGNGETVINGKGGAFNSFKMRHLVLNGVKTIEDTNSGGAFRNCTNLVSVVADDALEHVGVWAFAGCTALTTVEGFQNVTSIGNSAFAGCTSLPTIRLAPTLGTIEALAFKGCSSLCEVVIPDSVTDIEGWAFQDCPSITNIVIGRGMTYIPDSRFSYEMPNLDTVTINGNGETVINGKGGAFNSFKMRHLVLNGVKTIEDTNSGGAFRNCTNLVSVVADDALEHVGVWAFAGCTALTTLEGFQNVTLIGNSAFADCTSLPTINVPSKVGTIDSGAFARCTSATTVVIPDSVTDLGRGAFQDCTAIRSVSLGKGLGRIGEIIPESAVDLDTVVIDGNGETVVSANAFTRRKMRHLVLKGVKSFDDGNYGGAFSSCTNLQTVVADGSLERIGAWAFSGCTALTSVEGGTAVTSIGWSAFKDCTSLPELPDFPILADLGGNGAAFSGCTSMTNAVIPDTVTIMNDWTFSNCTGLRSITLGKGWSPIVQNLVPQGAEDLDTVIVKGDGETVIAGNAFFRCKMRHLVMSGVKAINGSCKECPNLEDVVADEALETIGEETFRACPKLRSVTGITGVKVIGDSAFGNYHPERGCPALAEIELPEGLEIIGECAFANCTNLTDVTVPDTVTNVGWRVWMRCHGLKNFTFGAGLNPIPGGLFDWCEATMDELTVNGGGTTEITDGAFNGMQIKRVVLNGVEKVGGSAFQNNAVLTEVYFDGDAPVVGANAFGGAAADCTAYVPYGSTGWGVDIPLTGKADWNYDGIAGHFVKIAYENAPSGDVGAWLRFDLVNDLDIVIPEDVDYAAGDKVTVKVEGLAKGLKLVATQQKETTGKKAVTNVVYTIEGVPTEEIDFERNPMYVRVTVTYKDKTKGDKGKIETLQPIPLSVVPAKVRTLAAGVLNEVYEPVDIAELWPDVADAKVNPKDWTFKGWPAGIKYNNTAKPVTAKQKTGGVNVTVTNALPYSVYGKPTKAGEFPITATHKYKLGKTTVSETFSAVLTVWGNDGATDFRYEDKAYVATETKTLGATFKSFSGLPTGVKWTTKPVTTKNKDKSVTTNVVAFSLYGTPTKPGVFAVTATKVDKTKETFLWQVTEGENPGLDAAQVGWGKALVKYDGAVTRTATLMQGLAADFAVDASALAAGAKVTVSGLPSGLKYDAKTGKIIGVATKAEKKVVTVKVVQNGVTEVRKFAIDVAANLFAGAYHGAFSKHVATAVITPAAGGTAKLVLDEYVPSKHKVVKYTATAKGFSMAEEYDPENPLQARIVYEFALKADAKNNPDFAAAERVLEVTLMGGALGQGGLLFGNGSVSLRAKDDPSSESGFSGQVYKALTSAAYATFVETTGMKPPPVMAGIARDKAGRHLFSGTAVLDEKKLRYQVTGKLRDGTAVKVLQPLCWFEYYLGAPSLFVEKGGDKRVNVAMFAGAGKLNDDIGIYEYESVVQFLSAEGVLQAEFNPFDTVSVAGTAAEEIGLLDQLLVLDKDELAAAGFEGEAPVFRFRVEKVFNLSKAKINIFAPDAKEGDKPLKTLSPVKLTASSGYAFKGSFKWDAKVGGDGNTYSFELVPGLGFDESFLGRCEVKPAKGASIVVTARLVPEIE